MATTFIDFTKPLDAQIGRMDEGEEFKLVRKTTDGKGWVWRALEEDNETFTTLGSPPSADDLFSAFESFVVSGNPTRFTGMQGIDGGGAGTFLKDIVARNQDAAAAAAAAEAARIAAAEAAAKTSGDESSFTGFTNNKWGTDIDDAGTGTGMQEAKAWLINDANILAGRVASGTARKGIPGAQEEAALRLPTDWEDRIDAKKADGSSQYPSYVQAYWYSLAVRERQDKINSERTKSQETYDKLVKTWTDKGSNYQGSIQGQGELKRINAAKAQLDSITSLYNDVATAYSLSTTSVNDLFTSGNDFDPASWTAFSEKYSDENISNALKGIAATTPTPTGTVGSGNGPKTGTVTLENGNTVTFNGTQAEFDEFVKTADIKKFEPGFPDTVSTDIDVVPNLGAGLHAGGASPEQLRALAVGASAAAQSAPSAQLGQTFEDVAARLGQTFTGGASPEQLRALAFEQQFPSTVFGRIGLGGGLAYEEDAEGERRGISTQSLSPLAQQGLQSYFNQTLEPGYAIELARRSQAQPVATGMTEPMSGMAAGDPYSTFESFARDQLGGGAAPVFDAGGQENLIAALQSQNQTDPYRQALLGYLEGGGDITGTGSLQNRRLMNALNAETLSQIAPIYRKQAADRMRLALQNQMVQAPERKMLSFYTGNRFDTIDPNLNFSTFAPPVA